MIEPLAYMIKRMSVDDVWDGPAVVGFENTEKDTSLDTCAVVPSSFGTSLTHRVCGTRTNLSLGDFVVSHFEGGSKSSMSVGQTRMFSAL
jgi:hypothetical protein